MADKERGFAGRARSMTASSDESGSSSATARNDEASGSGSGPKPTVTVNIHNPAVTYGGLNPEIEENIDIIKPVPAHDLRRDATDRWRTLGSDLDEDPNVKGKQRCTSAASRGSWIHASVPQTADCSHVPLGFVARGPPGFQDPAD